MLVNFFATVTNEERGATNVAFNEETVKTEIAKSEKNKKKYKRGKEARRRNNQVNK